MMALFTGIAVAVGAGIYYPFSSAAAQQRNISLARAHAHDIAPLLAADARFSAVRAVESAREGGSLLVVGTVMTTSDLDALRTLIENSHSPVQVLWSVSAAYTPSTTEPTSSLE